MPEVCKTPIMLQIMPLCRSIVPQAESGTFWSLEGPFGPQIREQFRRLGTVARGCSTVDWGCSVPPVGAGQQAQRAQPQLQRFFLPSLPPLPTPLTTDVRIFQPQGRCCAPWRGGPPRPPMARPAELRGRRGGRGHQAGTRPRSLTQPLPFLMRNGCALRSAHQGFLQRWAAPAAGGQGAALSPALAVDGLMVGDVRPRP